MIAGKQYLIICVISLLLFIGNGEAGWKFWKKDKETTTTTTTTVTPISIDVPSSTTFKGPTTATANIRDAVTGASNPGLNIGVGTTSQNVRNNARPNRPNPGTEVGLDIAVPRPNRPEVGGGNGKNYRDWAVDLTGAGEPSRNHLPVPGPTINNDGRAQPKIPSTGASNPASGNTPIQTSRPAAGGNTPQQPLPSSTGTVTKPMPVQHTTPRVSVSTGSSDGINNNRPGTPSSSNSGKSWADVAGGTRPVSPTGPSRQPVFPGDTLPAGGLAGVTNHATDSTKKVYSSNPTYSKGNTITDEDLEKLSEALYIKETNNVNRYITVNLQKLTTSSNLIDQAPQPLLTVNPEALQISTIQKVISIFDNYQLDTHTNEYISPAQRQEESLLVDTFLSTNVMSAAMRLLADKGFVRQDYYEYKDTLRRLWFNLFSRGAGKIGSTGFEHVFMAETKQVDSGTEVLGLHNWIYFNAEEIKRHADYLGYLKKVDLGNKGSIIKMHTKLNGLDKPVTTMFIGTSPELEMALYTVCFYARPDRNCPVSLGGTKFNIVTHKFRYRGKDLIGTAYPEI